MSFKDEAEKDGNKSSKNYGEITAKKAQEKRLKAVAN